MVEQNSKATGYPLPAFSFKVILDGISANRHGDGASEPVPT